MFIGVLVILGGLGGLTGFGCGSCGKSGAAVAVPDWEQVLTAILHQRKGRNHLFGCALPFVFTTA
jgi:hypothetical protein